MSDRYYEQAVYKACRVCNLPRNKRLDMAERFELAEWVLDWYGFGSSTFGVEYFANIKGDDSAGGAWYLNAGDTYDLTVLYPDDGYDLDSRGDFVATSWGDHYEAWETGYCVAENVTRCGNCSAFTPLSDDVDWSDTRCESCGRNVSTGKVMAEVADEDDEDDE